MMDDVRQYLLSITAAAVLCGAVNGLSGKSAAYSAVLKLISGLFLALTVISPWAKLQLIDLSQYTDSLTIDASAAVADGEIMARDQLSAIIKEQAEAYILDKATSMGLNIEVEVTLDSSNPPLPSAVTLRGPVSPFSKESISQYIANDLGIPEERQLWI